MKNKITNIAYKARFFFLFLYYIFIFEMNENNVAELISLGYFIVVNFIQMRITKNSAAKLIYFNKVVRTFLKILFVIFFN